MEEDEVIEFKATIFKNFKVGDWISIIKGHYAGYIGKIEKIDKDKYGEDLFRVLISTRSFVAFFRTDQIKK